MLIDHNILLRYFTNEASEREKDSIRCWLESDEAHRKQFIRERIRFDASVVADEEEVFFKKSKKINPARRLTYNILRVASVILLLITCSYFYADYRLRSEQSDKTTTQKIYVPPGSRTSITLPDGSVAWLNSNTTFIYPDNFRKGRIVEMSGEVYFDVIENENMPFIVNTGEYILEVLGTSFNVESYSNNNEFETAMFSGKVQLYKKGINSDTISLFAGQTARLIDDKLVISPTNNDLYRWKEGILVFDNESFEEIMESFEKYYDLKIKLRTDKVKKLGYSGKFRIVDGIDHALRVLQKDYRFVYKREEDSNVIYIY
jgi:Fe2+-dicitrate sensor, membrane component